MSSTTRSDDILALLSRPDDAIDLAGAALLIARDEYPQLDVAAYRSRLDDMAAEAGPRIAQALGNPFAAIDELNTFLFAEKGFRGNQEQYFDPRNSYLNDVLDRRRGIPITLSVIYMEVASASGFPLEGVGFPGHFLVRHAAEGREILIDPFHGGEILLAEDCRRRLAAVYGDDARLEAHHFETSGKRAILIRILQNLKHVYLHSQEFARALRVIDRLEAISPDDPRNLKDRGLAHAGSGQYGRAVADFEKYLELAPGSTDVREIREQIKSMRRRTATLN